MIDRYTRPEMGHIFSLENKYAIWQEIEVLACEAQAELGKIGISKDEAQWIRDHANFEKAKVDEIEEVTRHDVIAFLTNMKEYIDADVPEGDPKPSRWVHYGMTSSDLGDTALCYQLTQACDLIIEDVKKLGEICKRRAFEERNTLCAGRTHGIHAEPMTFGMKFGSWAWELKRDLDRLEDARKNVAFGAISALSARTAPSSRSSRSTSASTWAWFTTRCPRRLSAATITPISPAFLPPLRPPASASLPRFAICRRLIRSRPRSRSVRAKRAAQPCHTSATPSPWRRSAACRAS